MLGRKEASDTWDDLIAHWLVGDVTPRDYAADMARWRASYAGGGNGAVNLDHYPDPFVGDLRGLATQPRLVVLGLNPGVGYDVLQSRQGLWSKRIRTEGYSRCFKRSPAEDPEGWLEVRKSLGKGNSPYWSRLIGFTKRWLGDPRANVSDILNMELYPWHSNSLTAGINAPADIVRRYVFDPLSQVDVSDLFAFGAPWFGVAARLALRPLAAQRRIIGADDPSHWKVAIYELPSGQRLIVSSTAGSAGPPGEERIDQFRTAIS